MRLTGVDSRSGHAFCFQCQDYIYDPALEEIRIEHETSIDGGGELCTGQVMGGIDTPAIARKKRRLEDSKPSADDLKCIELHTTFAPCRATGLRGFLNMGSTCFMSVILQILIHNPLVRNFYLSDGHKRRECNQTNCMSCDMDDVFSEFFTSDKQDGYGPINLLMTSWKCEQVKRHSAAFNRPFFELWIYGML